MRAHGVTINRIIVTLDFHTALLQATPALSGLARVFYPKEEWVRHDEHYHVDFSVPANEHQKMSCK